MVLCVTCLNLFINFILKENDNLFFREVKFLDKKWIYNSHGSYFFFIESEVLKYSYQIGLGTLVVYTLNYEFLFPYTFVCIWRKINVKNILPKKYYCKVEI